MDAEQELILSFYKTVSDITEDKTVKLVRHIETGSFFVRKELDNYDLSVFKLLRDRDYMGIPGIEELVEDHDTGKLIVIEEFINGDTIKDTIDKGELFSEKETVDILTDLCDILLPLHQNDPPVVNRDIKPSNIIIRDGKPFIVDFDASREFDPSKTGDTELIGTKGYAAPEQYGFMQSDARTDIYALGMLAVSMMTGDNDKSRFPANSRMSAVIEKCTDMSPDARYQNVVSLKEDLLSVLDPHKKTKPMPYMIPGFRTRTIWKMALATVCYIAVLAIAIFVKIDERPIVDTVVERIGFVITSFGMILFTFNYLDIHKKLPLMKSDHIIVKMIGWYIYMLVWSALCQVIVSTISG